MKKLLILSFSIFLSSLPTQAQNTTGNLICVVGKVLSQKDSSGIVADLRYEKLPYYDDIGTGTSSADGSFEFYLIEGLTYTFTVKHGTHEEFKGEYVIEDADDDSVASINIFLMPDEDFEVMTLEHLIFARGSDKIAEGSYAGLDELAEWLEARPNTVVQLEGHTDFAGNSEANMRLSQARVDAVKEYLVKQGIKKGRLLTKAFGGTQPLTTERTMEAKTRNRRVEVRVVHK